MNTNDQKNQKFITEIAKYFMTFLETDFKKRMLPKRHTNQKTVKGSKVGIDVEKYPNLKKRLLSGSYKGFSNESFNIQKGKYKHVLPDTLQRLIFSEIEKISDKEYIKSIQAIAKNLKHLLVNIEEYDIFSEESLEFAKNSITKDCLKGFFSIVEGPLGRAGALHENAQFQIEAELIDAIFVSSESGFLDLCQEVLQKEKSIQDIEGRLKEVFSLNEIRATIRVFFKELQVNDFFEDLYELFRNNAIFDKTELYLYFYEISFDKNSFPVFYIPITVSQNQESIFTIQFDKRIFVNTKAIDYVVQQYNQQISNNSSLSGTFDRIIYVENEQNIDLKLKGIVSQLIYFFQFNSDFLQDFEYQRKEHLLVSLSNRCYVYLFDKSDEALINDYETIIDNDMIRGLFSNLVNGFIKENPVSVIRDVDDEWAAQDSVTKLIFESPIPLNEEQKRVLAASQKSDCSYMVIEGPPGTGKSHTITAIICKALLEEKSVLVLSDKKEALDVVEDKITDTLNKIRRDEGFQNPILRFGKAGNKFAKIVQGQAVEKIEEHYRVYKSKQDQYQSLYQNRIEALKKSISKTIKIGSKVKMQDIILSLKDECFYEDWHWFDGINSIGDDCLDNLLKLRKLIKKYRGVSYAEYPIFEVNQTNLLYLKHSFKQFKIIESNRSKFDVSENKDFLNIFSGQKNEKLVDDAAHLFDLVKKIELYEDKYGLESGIKRSSFILGHDLQDIVDEYALARDLAASTSEYLKEKNIRIEIFLFYRLPIYKSFQESLVQIENLRDMLTKYRLPFLGFLFSGKKKVLKINEFKKDFLYYEYSDDSKKLEGLNNVLDVMNFMQKKAKNNFQNENLEKNAFQILTILAQDQNELKCIYSNIDSLSESMKICKNLEKFPIASFEWAKQCFNIQRAIKELEISEEALKESSFQIILDYEVILYGDEQECLKNKVEENIDCLEKLIASEEDFNFIKNFTLSNERLANNLGIDLIKQAISKMETMLDIKSEEEIIAYMNFVMRKEGIRRQFQSLPNESFSDSINDLQELVTAKMAHFLDGRVLDYIESSASDVNTLKLILRKKQKFPKDLFEKLKKAFPCILAGIRDYAEYIPMNENLFDLIIIDEASQVSIAQALPALIRGKKVIVLGDDKQFSNVKSQNASSLMNDTFRFRVKNSFLDSLQNDDERELFLTKVQENFNIKNSILKFVRFIRNYECVLRKHFRCHSEIISYSNKYFYNDYLQCMKIRGCPIEDVIKFDVLELMDEVSQYKNVNEQESDFILMKLKEFVSNNDSRSIGIISPHREQVKYLTEKIYALSYRDELLKKNKLKIMTFDTCQGEERDYIFYTMVATEKKDRLKWIFVKNLSDVELEAEGKIRAQRLNVGFSRAKETVHFVLSKPVEEFSGEIRNALTHYKNELKNGKKKIVGGTDKNSPMEKKIQHYFYETKFYKDNSDNVEFIPQFPLGQYLKQLDRTYRHPLYKVDFLLIFKNEKIIIEYDGFREHFIDLKEVDELNYEYYMSEDDVYRQKVLEGYGYKFLRINKFNLGENPIEILNLRLEELLKKKL